MKSELKLTPLEEKTEKKEKKKKGGNSYLEGALDGMMLSSTRNATLYSQPQQTTSYGHTGGHNSHFEGEETSEKDKPKEKNSYLQGALDALSVHRNSAAMINGHQSQQTTIPGVWGGHNSHLAGEVERTATGISRHGINTVGKIVKDGEKVVANGTRNIRRVVPTDDITQASHGAQNITGKVIGGGTKIAGEVERTATGISRYGIDTFGEIAGAGKKSVVTSARNIRRVVPDDLTQAGHGAQNIAGEVRRNLRLDKGAEIIGSGGKKVADKTHDLVSQVNLGDAQRLGGHALQTGSKVAGQVASNITTLPIDKIATTAGNALREVPSAMPSPRGCMQFMECLFGLFR